MKLQKLFQDSAGMHFFNSVSLALTLRASLVHITDSALSNNPPALFLFSGESPLYTTYAHNDKKFGHSLWPLVSTRGHGRRKSLMDSHPYSYEISIFTLGVPHEEVQGRQTKFHLGFTLGKLVPYFLVYSSHQVQPCTKKMEEL